MIIAFAEHRRTADELSAAPGTRSLLTRLCEHAVRADLASGSAGLNGMQKRTGGVAELLLDRLVAIELTSRPAETGSCGPDLAIGRPGGLRSLLSLARRPALRGGRGSELAEVAQARGVFHGQLEHHGRERHEAPLKLRDSFLGER
jgi:hypothetical protein